MFDEVNAEQMAGEMCCSVTRSEVFSGKLGFQLKNALR